MKVSRILFIVLCFAFSFTAIHAQDKYEYGQVAYVGGKFGAVTKYSITISTNTFQSIADGKIDEGDISNNFVPVNKVLNDLADKGWEIYNTAAFSGGIAGFYYYIRKKK